MDSDDELFRRFLSGEDSPEIRSAFAPISVDHIDDLPSVAFDLYDNGTSGAELERKARAKAWLESRPDWMREGIEEARKQEAEWLAIRPPSYGREISKEEWGKLIDGAPEKWKKLFERLKQRRLAEQGDPSRKSAAPNDPLIAFVKNAMPATVPMTDDEKAAIERFRARAAKP